MVDFYLAWYDFQEKTLIVADHRCDPAILSTDHSREYVGLVAIGQKVKVGENLGTRESFADTEATILEYLGIKGDICGTSYLKEILLP